MSLPDRRWVILTPLALAACGFTPVYGTGGSGQRLQNNIRVDDPGDQNAYLLTRALEDRLGRSDAPTYALSLNISTGGQGLAIDREGDINRFNLTGSADYALRRTADGQIVSSGRVDSFTSYSATGTNLVTLAGEEDARRRLMTILADQIVTQLYAADLNA
jgi:LPS-assembly lipoprotein